MALARILKLPIIFDKSACQKKKKVDAAGETLVEHAAVREPSCVGSRAGALGPLVGSRGNARTGSRG